MSRRIKGKIARWTCGLSALAMLGVVGGLETFRIPTGAGIVALIFCFALILISGMKGGLFR